MNFLLVYTSAPISALLFPTPVIYAKVTLVTESMDYSINTCMHIWHMIKVSRCHITGLI